MVTDSFRGSLSQTIGCYGNNRWPGEFLVIGQDGRHIRACKQHLEMVVREALIETSYPVVIEHRNDFQACRYVAPKMG